jgi:AcrR family transcriptional regulator
MTERREQILAAALAEFTAHGVSGGSIEGIRSRSGASVGSIYHHFGSKEEIAATLYVEGLRSYQEGFVAALDAAASTRQGVEDAVRHHLAWIADHHELAAFLLLERDARVLVGSSEALRLLNLRFFRAVRDWTAPRVRGGELRALEPEVLTALWIGPSQELGRHWLADPGRVSLTEAAPELAGAAWRSLTPGG